LGATNSIVGRCTASAMASASRKELIKRSEHSKSLRGRGQNPAPPTSFAGGSDPAFEIRDGGGHFGIGRIGETPSVDLDGAHTTKPGGEQSIALRDHLVENHPTIGSDYFVFSGESTATAVNALAHRDGRYGFATVTLVLTELAMKQFSCAAWCILSSSSALGLRSPLHVIFGRCSTRVIAILPSAFFSMWPTASSSYESSTNLCFQAIARNVSMWQLESAATKASSGSTFAGLPSERDAHRATLAVGVESAL
jgi:hypothetical protein